MSMKSKRVLLVLSETPLEQNCIKGNLRTALGMSVGYKEHNVDVLFTGDAVFFLKMPGDQDTLKKFARTFTLLGSNLYIDEKSLEDKKIDRKLVVEPFKVKGRDEIIELYRNAEMTASM